jgi:uncharacterized membrane protein YciS (DUF1049 family)
VIYHDLKLFVSFFQISEIMPPATSNDTIYVSHTLVKSEVPIAICLSILFAVLFFIALYIFCCLAAMKGKLDIFAEKKFSKSPKKILRFVNPFKNFKRKDDGKIRLYRHVNSEENQTDTDTC